jgi:hypothetical protein
MAFHRETFNQYFIMNISINITRVSQIIIYIVSSLINIGSTNRNNGSVIVEAKIQMRASLLLEI